MRRAVCIALLVFGCDPPVRPMPPDTGPDAPVPDAPMVDAGRCAEFGGVYVTTSSCPGFGASSFTSCVAAEDCTGTVFLPTSTSEGRFELMGDRGAFSAPMLADGITCSQARTVAGGLQLECTDRGGRGCTFDLARRASTDEGLCCARFDDPAECGADHICTLRAVGGGPAEVTACVAREGPTVDRGAPCTRGAPGDDNCGLGAYCSTLGSVDGPRCRVLCRDAGDCSAAEICVSAGTVPRAGVCAPTCDVFAPTSCPAGLGCIVIDPLGAAIAPTTCAAAGTGTEGMPCEASGCVPGLLCARNDLLEFRCAAPCDATHTCSAGTCMLLDDGPLGVCR